MERLHLRPRQNTRTGREAVEKANELRRGWI